MRELVRRWGPEEDSVKVVTRALENKKGRWGVRCHESLQGSEEYSVAKAQGARVDKMGADGSE